MVCLRSKVIRGHVTSESITLRFSYDIDIPSDSLQQLDLISIGQVQISLYVSTLALSQQLIPLVYLNESKYKPLDYKHYNNLMGIVRLQSMFLLIFHVSVKSEKNKESTKIPRHWFLLIAFRHKITPKAWYHAHDLTERPHLHYVLELFVHVT